MPSQSARPTEETAALADLMTDPLNRHYRYRVAHWLLPLFMRTPITPNGITYLHSLVGIATGVFVARGNPTDLVIAFFLGELRMVLDCLDGVLARAKKMSSPYGRALDELGDAVGYIALLVGMGVFIHKHHPQVPVVALQITVFACGFFMAGGWDFYKRKFTAALKLGKDAIYEDLHAKAEMIRKGEAGTIVRIGYAIDWVQITLLQSGTKADLYARVDRDEKPGEGGPEVEHILRNAHSRGLRTALRLNGLMSGDNTLAIFHVGLLTGNVLAAEIAVLVYGAIMMVCTVSACNAFLGSARRAVESEQQ